MGGRWLIGLATELGAVPTPPRKPPDALDTTSEPAPPPSRKPPDARPAASRCAPRSLRSLRCLLPRGGVERPAPFGPTRVCGPTSVGGGPAGFSVGPTCDRRRDPSACRPRLAPAHPAGVRSDACSLRWRARRPRVRERRALVCAARVERAEVVAVRSGAVRPRYGSLLVRTHTRTATSNSNSTTHTRVTSNENPTSQSLSVSLQSQS
jgi:hypothetical protein